MTTTFAAPPPDPIETQTQQACEFVRSLLASCDRFRLDDSLRTSDSLTFWVEEIPYAFRLVFELDTTDSDADADCFDEAPESSEHVSSPDEETLNVMPITAHEGGSSDRAADLETMLARESTKWTHPLDKANPLQAPHYHHWRNEAARSTFSGSMACHALLFMVFNCSNECRVTGSGHPWTFLAIKDIGEFRLGIYVIRNEAAPRNH